MDEQLALGWVVRPGVMTDGKGKGEGKGKGDGKGKGEGDSLPPRHSELYAGTCVLKSDQVDYVRVPKLDSTELWLRRATEHCAEARYSSHRLSRLTQ